MFADDDLVLGCCCCTAVLLFFLLCTLLFCFLLFPFFSVCSLAALQQQRVSRLFRRQCISIFSLCHSAEAHIQCVFLFLVVVVRFLLIAICSHRLVQLALCLSLLKLSWQHAIAKSPSFFTLTFSAVPILNYAQFRCALFFFFCLVTQFFLFFQPFVAS